MEAWAPLTLSAVAANGVVTQLYPSHCAAGDVATTAGSWRRRPTQGNLYRIEVFTSDAAGGVIELYDIAGEEEGANNNVSTGTSMTDAYLDAKIAANTAKMIWTQNFKGDAASRSALFSVHVPFLRGLAARYVNVAGTSVQLSVVASGGYMRVQMMGL